MTYQITTKKQNHLYISGVFDTIKDHKRIRDYIDDNDIEVPCVLELSQTRLTPRVEAKLKGMCVPYEDIKPNEAIVWEIIDGAKLTTIANRMDVSVPYISKLYANLYRKRRD